MEPFLINLLDLAHPALLLRLLLTSQSPLSELLEVVLAVTSTRQVHELEHVPSNRQSVWHR